MPSSENLYQSGFTFYDVEKIKTSLSEENIFMSTPSAVTDHTIGNYCAVNYCTVISNSMICNRTRSRHENIFFR